MNEQDQQKSSTQQLHNIPLEYSIRDNSDELIEYSTTPEVRICLLKSLPHSEVVDFFALMNKAFIKLFPFVFTKEANKAVGLKYPIVAEICRDFLDSLPIDHEKKSLINCISRAGQHEDYKKVPYIDPQILKAFERSENKDQDKKITHSLEVDELKKSRFLAYLRTNAGDIVSAMKAEKEDFKFFFTKLAHEITSFLQPGNVNLSSLMCNFMTYRSTYETFSAMYKAGFNFGEMLAVFANVNADVSKLPIYCMSNEDSNACEMLINMESTASYNRGLREVFSLLEKRFKDYLNLRKASEEWLMNPFLTIEPSPEGIPTEILWRNNLSMSSREYEFMCKFLHESISSLRAIMDSHDIEQKDDNTEYVRKMFVLRNYKMYYDKLVDLLKMLEVKEKERVIVLI